MYLTTILPTGGIFPSSDTYIEKDASINDEIDKLRHSATDESPLSAAMSLSLPLLAVFTALGDPEDYSDLVLSLRLGQNEISR